MATKKSVSNTSAKKTSKNSRKKLIALAIILLAILVFGVLRLNRPKYTATKGPSTHSAADTAASTKNATPAAAASADAAAANSSTNTTSTTTKKSATAAGSSASGSSAAPAPAASPAPTPDPFNIEPPYAQVSPTYDCGAGSHQFNFTASVTANGAGTITYRWVFSDGASTPGQYTFTGAGTHQFQNSWTLGQQDYSGWGQLEVTAPVETASKQSDADFTLESTCTP